MHRHFAQQELSKLAQGCQCCNVNVPCCSVEVLQAARHALPDNTLRSLKGDHWINMALFHILQQYNKTLLPMAAPTAFPYTAVQQLVPILAQSALFHSWQITTISSLAATSQKTSLVLAQVQVYLLPNRNKQVSQSVALPAHQSHARELRSSTKSTIMISHNKLHCAIHIFATCNTFINNQWHS